MKIPMRIPIKILMKIPMETKKSQRGRIRIFFRILFFKRLR